MEVVLALSQSRLQTLFREKKLLLVLGKGLFHHTCFVIATLVRNMPNINQMQELNSSFTERHDEKSGQSTYRH